MTAAAAIIAIGLLVVIAVYQLALALGAPWGAAAWGGQNPGVLPRRLRIASGVAGVVIYPLLIVLVLNTAGWTSISGGSPNVASRSPIERIWGPVALVTAICFVILALNA